MSSSATEASQLPLPDIIDDEGGLTLDDLKNPFYSLANVIRLFSANDGAYSQRQAAPTTHEPENSYFKSSVKGLVKGTLELFGVLQIPKTKITKDRRKEFSEEEMGKMGNIFREMLHQVVGEKAITWEDFCKLATETRPTAFSKNPDIEAMELRLYDHLEFLPKEWEPHSKKEKIMALADEADSFIESTLVTDYMTVPGELNLLDGPKNCKSLMDLLYLAGNSDDKVAKRARFEAMRKFFLILFLGKSKYFKYNGENINSGEAQKDLDNFLNETFAPKGVPWETTTTGYLSFLPGKIFGRGRIKYPEITNEPQKGKQNIKLIMREMCLTDLEGVKRTTRVFKYGRRKKDGASIIKATREGEDIGVLDTDVIGQRLIFKNEDDLYDFDRNFQETILDHIEEKAKNILMEIKRDIASVRGDEVILNQLDAEKTRIKDRLRVIQKERELIVIEEKIYQAQKDGKQSEESKLEDEKKKILRDIGSSKRNLKKAEIKNGLYGGIEGRSAISKSPKTLKCKLKINGIERNEKDERQYNYEMQYYLPEGYAEILYTDLAHEIYSILRFYSNKDFPKNRPADLELPYGEADLFFPNSIYDVNKGELKARAIESAYNRVQGQLEEISLIRYLSTDLRHRLGELSELLKEMEESAHSGVSAKEFLKDALFRKGIPRVRRALARALKD